MNIRAGMLLLGLVPGVLQAQAKPADAKARVPRLLFVIDAETENPIAGVTVRDLITKNSMETSVAGVVGLFVPTFVRSTGAIIEVSIDGYITSDRIFVDPMVDSTIVIGIVRQGSPRAQGLVRQRKDSTIFRFEVVDETGAPMDGARVSIVRGVATSMAAHTTDTTGLGTLAVPDVDGEVQITAQKIGYSPYRQFYRLNLADTVIAQVAMYKPEHRLGAINIVAKANVKRRLYHIDQNEIATSRRPILNALDIVRKLRPDMLGRRTVGVPGCGLARRVFVNGRRVRYPPQNINPALIAMGSEAPRSLRGSPFSTKSGLGEESRQPTMDAPAVDTVRSILAGIKPEHVSEITYVDCFDTSVSGLYTSNAVFVVLKLGVGYDEGRGSFFVRDSTARRK